MKMVTMPGPQSLFLVHNFSITECLLHLHAAVGIQFAATSALFIVTLLNHAQNQTSIPVEEMNPDQSGQNSSTCSCRTRTRSSLTNFLNIPDSKSIRLMLDYATLVTTDRVAMFTKRVQLGPRVLVLMVIQCRYLLVSTVQATLPHW